MFRWQSIVVVFCLLGLCLLGPVAGASAQEAFWVGLPVVSVAEGAGSIDVQIALTSAPVNGPGGLHYQTEDVGSATTESDYLSMAGELFWDVGESHAQTITIPIVDDVEAEATEHFIVVLGWGDGVSGMAGDDTLRIEIIDNEAGNLPQVTMLGPVGNAGEARDTYCTDAQGEAYVCDHRYTVSYSGAPYSVRFIADPAPTETLVLSLAASGAVGNLPGTVSIGTDGLGEVSFSVPTTPSAFFFGSIQITSTELIAPVTPTTFHELDVLLEGPQVSGVECVWCYIMMDALRLLFGNECGVMGSCASVVYCGAGGGNKAVDTSLGLLRRYRDEILTTTAEGLAVVDLYGRMSTGAATTVFAHPNLVTDVMSLRNSWLPALQNLLDSDGLMPVSPAMQTSLTAVLDGFSAAGTGDFVRQLADLRSAASLDALVGTTISAASAQFENGGALPVEGTSWGELKALYR